MLEMLEKREINACMLNISVSHVDVAVSRIRVVFASKANIYLDVLNMIIYFKKLLTLI